MDIIRPPDPGRQPLSFVGRRKGFKPLADYVFTRRTEVRIHIMRGIRQPAADTPVEGAVVHAPIRQQVFRVPLEQRHVTDRDVAPGAQAYYDSIIALRRDGAWISSKADDILRPIHRDEIAAIPKAILRRGGPSYESFPRAGARGGCRSFCAGERPTCGRSPAISGMNERLLHENFTLVGILGRRRPARRMAGCDMLPLGASDSRRAWNRSPLRGSRRREQRS